MRVTQVPIASATLANDLPLQQWMRALGTHMDKATKVQTIQQGTESLNVVDKGSILFWEYTGKGGVSFDYNGTKITVPETTDPVFQQGSKMVGV